VASDESVVVSSEIRSSVESRWPNTGRISMVNPPRWKSVLVQFDTSVSHELFRWYHEHVNSTIPLRLLEWTGHGVPWLVLTPMVIVGHLMRSSTSMAWTEEAVNFYVGLYTDLALIACMKLIFRRPRPPYDGGRQSVTVDAVDMYSFPSGHATRSIFIACFLSYVVRWRRHGMLGTVLLAWSWAIAVCFSRVMYGRHFVFDVFGGILVGCLNFYIIHGVWLSKDAILEWVGYLPLTKTKTG